MSSWIWGRRLFVSRYGSSIERSYGMGIQYADWDVVCGSLADGKDRPMRQGDYCECEDGWTGINCNVCTTNQAFNALMPKPDDGGERSGGVCYQNGEVVKENYQMCDVTNKKIVDILEGKRPQVTFTCNAERETCDFQCRCNAKLSLQKLTYSSLGRASGIFLLHTRYLLFLCPKRSRTKQHQL
jgi:hypothetical protein